MSPVAEVGCQPLCELACRKRRGGELSHSLICSGNWSDTTRHMAIGPNADHQRMSARPCPVELPVCHARSEVLAKAGCHVCPVVPDSVQHTSMQCGRVHRRAAQNLMHT